MLAIPCVNSVYLPRADRTATHYGEGACSAGLRSAPKSGEHGSVNTHTHTHTHRIECLAIRHRTKIRYR